MQVCEGLEKKWSLIVKLTIRKKKKGDEEENNLIRNDKGESVYLCNEWWVEGHEVCT